MYQEYTCNQTVNNLLFRDYPWQFNKVSFQLHYQQTDTSNEQSQRTADKMNLKVETMDVDQRNTGTKTSAETEDNVNRILVSLISGILRKEIRLLGFLVQSYSRYVSRDKHKPLPFPPSLSSLLLLRLQPGAVDNMR